MLALTSSQGVLKHELLFAIDVAVRHLSAQSRLSLSIHLASPGTLVRFRYVRQEAIQSLWDAFSEFQDFCLDKWLVESRTTRLSRCGVREVRSTTARIRRRSGSAPVPLPW